MEIETKMILISAMLAVTVFTLTPHVTAAQENLSVTVSTDNETYHHDEIIKIYGTVLDQNNNPVDGTAEITLSYGTWTRSTEVQVENGYYNWYYLISFGDPAGTWNISVDATDGTNSGSASGNTTVSYQEGVMKYIVEIYSPPSGEKFYRMDNISISVGIKEGENLVTGAEVWCYSPSGENISFIEVQNGIYTGFYTITGSDRTGEWSISIGAKKTTDNTLKAGGNYVTVSIMPAPLQVNLISPSDTKISAEKNVDIQVVITYPDNSHVENATVVLTAPDGENVKMVEQGSGVYGYSFTASQDDIGLWEMTISASDTSGNSGSRTIFLVITPPETNTLLYLVLVGGSISAVAGVGIFLGKKRITQLKLDKIEAERKHILKLQEKATKNYFKEGIISRQAYDYLMDEYAARLAELDRLRASEIKEKMKKRGKT